MGTEAMTNSVTLENSHILAVKTVFARSIIEPLLDLKELRLVTIDSLLYNLTV